ncbi:sugar ABC transporter substrate-binding protein [Paractinoplanes rishiriensis]|uniref:Sugar ABC transporter substrate-binding protein n=1 Tax=Paractinoplanes rishiriensis TaxID=1050105 RepID=A0A919N2W1_9ACTN|nr:sugar ABC transporter substrate-binding protein [Actinoplanes rishiriensis]
MAAVVGLSGSACLAEPGAGRNRGAEDDVVEVMYGFSGDQSRSFQDIVQPWADQNGIKVRLSSTPDFDKLIRSRVAGNNLPDIAIYPQPGITLDIALSGRLFDLNTVVDTSRYNKNNMYLFDAASDAEGRVWAIPMSTSVKSLVWYPKKAFEAKGYTVPKTHQELLALTDKIKADGTPPWCVGIESQAATGWPATDWVEDYVLRFGGGAKYKQWTSHQIPFNDPLIQQAVDEIGKIWFPEGNVLGDRGSIASTNFATAGNPMFENPPKCFLHRQASFLAQPGNFPDRIVQNIDTEAGVFPLPPVQAGAGQPVLGAGDLAGLFNDNPDTVRVLEFITSKEFGNQLAPDGGFISPWKDFDRSKYPNETMRAIAEIAYSSTEAVFDGSDTMPGEVGSGSFWRGMVTWVTGQEDTATVLRDIDESWPDY